MTNQDIEGSIIRTYTKTQQEGTVYLYAIQYIFLLFILNYTAMVIKTTGHPIFLQNYESITEKSLAHSMNLLHRLYSLENEDCKHYFTPLVWQDISDENYHPVLILVFSFRQCFRKIFFNQLPYYSDTEKYSQMRIHRI